MWETATRVASIINGTATTGDSVMRSDQPDRCPRCLCDDCGGLLSEHTEAGCRCESCAPHPNLMCTAFMPSKRIGFIAEQLGPLLSVHLGPRQQRRCLAVAHAAHHALHDYDHPGER
jgi:hypothetical protein